MDDSGPVAGGTTQLAFIELSPPAPAPGAAPSRPPIILIHGSPGSARDFERVAPLLARAGYRVIAVDLPGFGQSSRHVPSYSVLAHARSVLAFMDALGIPRAHVLGWSMGGGVVLHMADLDPGRVASITLLAAIGSQETEGSGSYFFEHFKYRAGYALFVGVPEAIPHFGLLPDPRDTLAHSWLRNFDDTDMRPLRGIMSRLRTPTLVLHGRRDFLVPDWAAELHAQHIPGSSLVMLDASHFLPFMQPQKTAECVLAFVQDHDEPAAAPESARLIEEPPRAHATGVLGEYLARSLRGAPWWIIVLGVAAISVRRPNLALVVAAALAAQVRIDPAVGATGVALGRLFPVAVCYSAARRPTILRALFGVDLVISTIDWQRRFSKASPGFWLGARSILRPDRRLVAPRALRLCHADALSTVFFAAGTLAGVFCSLVLQYLPAMIASMIAGATLGLDRPVETPGQFLLRLGLFALSFGLIYLVISALPLLLTWTGRRMLLANFRRTVYSEFWPAKFFYAPLVPYYAYLILRTRRLVPFTACNPAMSGHGGVIGESKHEIQSCLDHATGLVLPSVRIDAGPSPRERAASAAALIERSPQLGGFPVIIKPDSGFRGFSVRLVRTPRDFLPYFKMMHDPAMLQRYHPGPHEVGVMWVRRLPPPAPSEPPLGDSRGQHQPARTGAIYSITRKDFPFITGDGRRTLEQLIYRHPRLRCQARVFLARFADDASRVLAAGERVRLAQSGNHCQGTLFRDGSDILTPELEHAIDHLAATFARHRTGAIQDGFDIGRFDLRFESIDDLKAGRNFGVLELNGTTGESTNVYDPEKSLVWRYRVLFGVWRHLFMLGTWRANQGFPTLRVATLFRSLRSFFRSRTGSELAD